MDHPVLLAVDDDVETLALIERELDDRYGRHYQVVCLRTPDEATERLAELRRVGRRRRPGARRDSSCRAPPAASCWASVRRSTRTPGGPCSIEWGDWGQNPTGTGDLRRHRARVGSTTTWCDRRSPRTSMFHQTISSMLLDWAEAHRAAPYTVHIVGESWSGRAYELREALQPCALPHTFCLAGLARGQASSSAAAGEGVELPIMVFPNGEVLANPTNAEIAVAAGAPVDRARWSSTSSSSVPGRPACPPPCTAGRRA